MTYIPRLRPDPERKIATTTEIDATDTGGGSNASTETSQGIRAANRWVLTATRGTDAASRTCYCSTLPRARADKSMVVQVLIPLFQADMPEFVQ